MRELRINPLMPLSFCTTLPRSVMVALLILANAPTATVCLVLAGAVSVALFGLTLSGLIYALDFLTRCLAMVDGAPGK